MNKDPTELTSKVNIKITANKSPTLTEVGFPGRGTLLAQSFTKQHKVKTLTQQDNTYAESSIQMKACIIHRGTYVFSAFFLDL